MTDLKPCPWCGGMYCGRWACADYAGDIMSPKHDAVYVYSPLLRTTDTVIVTADGEDISIGDAQERWTALEAERRRLLEEMGKLRAAAQDYIEGNNTNLIRFMEPED